MTEPRLPPGAENWNRAHRGAYLKGARAALAGERESACPYQDHRKPSGRLSWSRSFIAAWRDGWRDHSKTVTPVIDGTVKGA